MKTDKTILSLFDYSGNWSRPYREKGYNVIQVDIKLGQDIMTLDCKSMPSVYGVLAAVPCTAFAASGARWFAIKDRTGETAHFVKLLYKTLEIVKHCNPSFWAIENPVGRIGSFTKLPKPFYFQPCDYGDPYTKKTGLWGNFVPPLPLFSGGYYQPVYPTEGSKMHLLPPSKDRATLRSVTPPGFAQAFYEANK